MKGIWVKGRVRGLNAERLMNEANRRGIRLYAARRTGDREIEVRAAPQDYGAFAALAREKGYAAGEGTPGGLWKALLWLKSRWGLMAGLALGAAVAAYSFAFVWAVRVEGAGAYEADARECLEEWGVRPGILRSSVNLTALREKLEWRWPRVQWVRTGWDGVSLVVTLDEGEQPPEVITAGRNGDVVAAEDGLLVRLTVFAGTAEAKEGDFVRAGQVLIRGTEGEAGAPVKARGEAVARVWVAARSRLPLGELTFIPTGRRAGRTLLQTPFFSYAFSGGPEYLTADREDTVLPVGGAWIPVWAVREEYIEEQAERAERDAEEVKKEGQRAALALLSEALRGQETVDKWINFSMIEGDTIWTEAVAEVRRDIGRFEAKE